MVFADIIENMSPPVPVLNKIDKISTLALIKTPVVPSVEEISQFDEVLLSVPSYASNIYTIFGKRNNFSSFSKSFLPLLALSMERCISKLDVGFTDAQVDVSLWF